MSFVGVHGLDSLHTGMENTSVGMGGCMFVDYSALLCIIAAIVGFGVVFCKVFCLALRFTLLLSTYRCTVTPPLFQKSILISLCVSCIIVFVYQIGPSVIYLYSCSN